MNLPYGETVQWEQYIAGALDSRGNPIDSWESPAEIRGCGFDPGASIEPRDGSSQRVITTPTLYPPKGLPIGPRDRITVRGARFEVEGNAADWRHPMTGWDPGLLVVNLRRVDG